MERITTWPGPRLTAYMRAHPGVSISQVEGIWRAWIPDGAGSGGSEAHGHTEEELLAKLAAPR